MCPDHVLCFRVLLSVWSNHGIKSAQSRCGFSGLRRRARSFLPVNKINEHEFTCRGLMQLLEVVRVGSFLGELLRVRWLQNCFLKSFKRQCPKPLSSLKNRSKSVRKIAEAWELTQHETKRQTDFEQCSSVQILRNSFVHHMQSE